MLALGPFSTQSLELLQRLAAARPQTPVIAMSGPGEAPTTVRTTQAGATGCRLKPLTEEVVLAAVGHALARNGAVLQRETESLDQRRRCDTLSSREREVMARMVAGLLTEQVGASAGISDITVKAHRGKVTRKMGAASLAALVSMALGLQLPPVPLIPSPAALRRNDLPSSGTIRLAPPATLHHLRAAGEQREQQVRFPSLAESTEAPDRHHRCGGTAPKGRPEHREISAST